MCTHDPVLSRTELNKRGGNSGGNGNGKLPVLWNASSLNELELPLGGGGDVFFFFLSLYAFPPKGALGYEAE